MFHRIVSINNALSSSGFESSTQKGQGTLNWYTGNLTLCEMSNDVELGLTRDGNAYSKSKTKTLS